MVLRHYGNLGNPCDDDSRSVLDLFCGMGGLSHGFAQCGFKVTGVDLSEKAGLVFSKNSIGAFLRRDLMNSRIQGEYEIIIGGPPCEPWSCLNLTRRNKNHLKYKCLSAFFKKVKRKKPFIFVMENVPAVQKDPLLIENLEDIRKHYDTDKRTITYSDYGAASARHRFFIIGVKLKTGVKASELLDSIAKENPKTVQDVIGDLKDRNQDTTIDHIWPNVKTIHKYAKYYKTGKYGWYVLKWNRPSPSFGNITKTYILHPDSFNNGNDPRPISIREALRIVGFPDEYKFPEGLDMRTKYELIADAVSPVFSLKLAKAIKELILSA